MGFHVYFGAHSGDLNFFEDWIPLLTLCLAPLVANLISGVHSPTYLHPSRPRWHDRIVLYNPTSIVWRYFAIADLRVRCRAWDAFHMAASSSLFWTAQGWDGSVQVLQKSRDYYTYPASGRTRVELLSFSAVKTLVVTLQGVQALYSLIAGNYGKVGGLSNEALALDVLFFPLAILGLLRLPAALWLSDENEYRDEDGASHTSRKPFPDARTGGAEGSMPLTGIVEVVPAEIYYPPSNWRGVLVRSIWLITVIGLWGLSISSLIPFGVPVRADSRQRLTQFLIGLLYVLLLSVSVPTAVIVAIRKSPSTALPCMNSWWYKAYTLFLFVSMFFVFIIAALETRKTPCGRFTSLPAAYDGAPGLCPSSSYVSIVEDSLLPGAQIQVQPVDLKSSRGPADGWCEMSRAGILPGFKWV